MTLGLGDAITSGPTDVLLSGFLTGVWTTLASGNAFAGTWPPAGPWEAQ